MGAQIKARFPGHASWVELGPLSGGQQSIVALALIFAIQRCDPSPFYLFDEVDDSLDPMYKTAVAKLIRGQADKGVQFFTVTFSKQLVEVRTPPPTGPRTPTLIRLLLVSERSLSPPGHACAHTPRRTLLRCDPQVAQLLP